ncbi:hypothetical protein BT93_I0078 [Corymbia citriodora subsp. variegata]|nr:hypothetical protein BT93_I0078 [Corymbia citriodora subsp. variegata]
MNESSMDSNCGHERRSTHFGDNFSSLDEVTTALREAGLESSNLILGIDFTKSNEWSGKHSFGRRSLHAIGPTSFAPIIDAAIDIVARSNGQYHVLVIVADGQVTRSPDVPRGRFSPQEQLTVDSIVAASRYPLSIILVGVGDGPWEAMKQFDDNIPQRAFDNFQFVNFTEIMSKNTDTSKKETTFALAALMEIPLQYRATQSILRVNDAVIALRTRPLPPPIEVCGHTSLDKSIPDSSLKTQETGSAEQVCPICLANPKNMAFGCGHLTCKDCGATLSTCPLCRQPITTRLRLFT